LMTVCGVGTSWLCDKILPISWKLQFYWQNKLKSVHS
jgi:hypothetical protein